MKETHTIGRSRRNETLQKLLRGEISAVETYRQAIDKSGDHERVRDLLRLMHEHQQAVEHLRRHIAGLGGKPGTASEAWGTWTKAVEDTANVLGDFTALLALKKGEELGIEEYERALGGEQLDDESASLIRYSLLPRQRTHIAMLNRLIMEQ